MNIIVYSFHIKILESLELWRALEKSDFSQKFDLSTLHFMKKSKVFIYFLIQRN